MSVDGLGLDSGERDLIVLHDGTVLETHGPARCRRTFCTIHHPSDHPLKEAPLVWSRRTNLMLRICDHGCEHPDPDSAAVLNRPALIRHECCPDHCCGMVEPSQ